MSILSNHGSRKLFSKQWIYDENGIPYCTSQKTERPKRKENINLLKRLPKLF